MKEPEQERDDSLGQEIMDRLVPIYKPKEILRLLSRLKKTCNWCIEDAKNGKFKINNKHVDKLLYDIIPHIAPRFIQRYKIQGFYNSGLNHRAFMKMCLELIRIVDNLTPMLERIVNKNPESKEIRDMDLLDESHQSKSDIIYKTDNQTTIEVLADIISEDLDDNEKAANAYRIIERYVNDFYRERLKEYGPKGLSKLTEGIVGCIRHMLRLISQYSGKIRKIYVNKPLKQHENPALNYINSLAQPIDQLTLAEFPFKKCYEEIYAHQGHSIFDRGGSYRHYKENMSVITKDIEDFTSQLLRSFLQLDNRLKVDQERVKEDFERLHKLEHLINILKDRDVNYLEPMRGTDPLDEHRLLINNISKIITEDPNIIDDQKEQ